MKRSRSSDADLPGAPGLVSVGRDPRRLSRSLSFHQRHDRAERASEPDADAREYTRDDASAVRNAFRVDADADRRFHRNAAHPNADVRNRLDARDVHAHGGFPDADAGGGHADRHAHPAEPDGDALRGHAHADTIRRRSDAHGGSPDADAGGGHADRHARFGEPDADALRGYAHPDPVRRRSDAHAIADLNAPEAQRAAAISATIARAAAAGSDAPVIGRPTTRMSAPAWIASAGVATRL
jgi:hypothetical protein